MRLWSFIVVALLAAGALSSCGNPDRTRYAGNLRIEKTAGLSDAERKVEERFASYLERYTDEAIEAYRATYGNVIDTDKVRELSDDYAPQRGDDVARKRARTAWSAAVQEPASALAKEMYHRMLSEKLLGEHVVVFMAGGAGAGKTTGVEQFPDLAEEVADAQIVYDTTLSSFGSAVDKIDQALAASKAVRIVYIYRDPVDSLIGALERARNSGRTLPLDAFLETHLGAGEVLLQIADKYKDRVVIDVIDNSRGRENARKANLAFVQQMNGVYDRSDLMSKLRDTLETARDTNGLADDIYQAFKGKAR